MIRTLFAFFCKKMRKQRWNPAYLWWAISYTYYHWQYLKSLGK